MDIGASVLATYSSGDFRAFYENDGKPFSGFSGDGNDQYRTAALSLSADAFSTGFNFWQEDVTGLVVSGLNHFASATVRLLSCVTLQMDRNLKCVST